MSNDIKKAKIDALVPDDMNANKGTEYGKHLMTRSFEKFGAWRSIAADKNLKIAAGNKSLETFVEAGFEDIIIVPTNGKQLVVVQRTDIDSSTSEGKKMFVEYGLADNATSKANLDWDKEVIEEITEQWEVDAKEWGIVIEDLPLEPPAKGNENKPVRLIVDCGDSVMASALFSELQERGFKCEIKE